MSLPWKYVLLSFLLTWIVWVPGTLVHADVIILTFGSAGPALAAVWLARRGKSNGQPSRRPARMFHTLSVATHDLPMSTALRSGAVLDVPSSTPPAGAGRAPCIHGHLLRLTTKPCETSGLAAVPAVC
jgi:hypothetical protein